MSEAPVGDYQRTFMGKFHRNSECSFVGHSDVANHKNLLEFLFFPMVVYSNVVSGRCRHDDEGRVREGRTAE